MESKRIKQILLIIAIALALLLALIINTEFRNYIYVVGVLLGIDIIVLFIYHNNTKTSDSIFKSKIRNIINTYDSILVKVDILPDLSDKDIVYISKFEELINAQGETKKPIFYSVTEKTAAFVLIDNNLVCYSIIKENDSFIDPIESKLMTINAKRKVKDVDESILADLDKTTIIKLPNIGSYKVSPIRKKEEQTKVEQPITKEPKEEPKTEYKEEVKKNHSMERARKYREKLRKMRKVG
ncbi:MAG: hypothetical protein E7171_00485 [Firmicutes bacterium]|nr:hypothetical protein [Bacillota bacterium]